MGSPQMSCYVYDSLLQLFPPSTTGLTHILLCKHGLKLNAGLIQTAAIESVGKSKLSTCLPYLDDGLTLHNITLQQSYAVSYKLAVIPLLFVSINTKRKKCLKSVSFSCFVTSFRKNPSSNKGTERRVCD